MTSTLTTFKATLYLIRAYYTLDAANIHQVAAATSAF